jgi:hypothetical protein
MGCGVKLKRHNLKGVAPVMSELFCRIRDGMCKYFYLNTDGKIDALIITF